MSKRLATVPIVADSPELDSGQALRKAVEAIAIKPRAGKLTLLSRKLFNILLAKAQVQGINASLYSISLSELCAIAQFDSSDTELIKEHLRKMVSTTVEWSNGVKGARRWGITTLIGGVELIEQGQRCTITWTYSEQIKEKLLAPNVYTRLSLQFQNSFRSAAALALYEICIRYVDSPGQLTMRMPWTEWRPTLTGTPDSDKEPAYAEYKYFKRDVLRPALSEVSSLTDIEVELIEHKLGRSVADIQFSVRPKPQGTLDLDERNLLDMALVARMLALGLSEGQAEKLYADHEEDRIRAALDYTEKRLKQKPAIENVPGYFRRALTEAYGRRSAEASLGEAKQPLLKGPVKKTAVPSVSELAESLAAAWWLEKRKAARASFDAESEPEQKRRLEEFVQSGLPAHLSSAWRKGGLNNKLCEAAFTQWLVRETAKPSELELLQFGLASGRLAATA